MHCRFMTAGRSRHFYIATPVHKQKKIYTLLIVDPFCRLMGPAPYLQKLVVHAAAICSIEFVPIPP